MTPIDMVYKSGRARITISGWKAHFFGSVFFGKGCVCVFLKALGHTISVL
jgi:hypothetical protein